MPAMEGSLRLFGRSCFASFVMFSNDLRFGSVISFDSFYEFLFQNFKGGMLPVRFLAVYFSQVVYLLGFSLDRAQVTPYHRLTSSVVKL